ncbi:MAG: hypothetical protein ACI4K9_08390 [Candidatus Fimenecus sp.]
MNKEEKINYLVSFLTEQFNTPMINVSQFAKAMSISRDRARVILQDIPPILNGKEKLYFPKEAAIAYINQGKEAETKYAKNSRRIQI